MNPIIVAFLCALCLFTGTAQASAKTDRGYYTPQRLDAMRVNIERY